MWPSPFVFSFAEDYRGLLLVEELVVEVNLAEFVGVGLAEFGIAQFLEAGLRVLVVALLEVAAGEVVHHFLGVAGLLVEVDGFVDVAVFVSLGGSSGGHALIVRIELHGAVDHIFGGTVLDQEDVLVGGEVRRISLVESHGIAPVVALVLEGHHSFGETAARVNGVEDGAVRFASGDLLDGSFAFVEVAVGGDGILVDVHRPRVVIPDDRLGK